MKFITIKSKSDFEAIPKIYTNNKSNGGNNPCIVGKPTLAVANVAANCVGVAVAIYNYLNENPSCSWLGSVNAGEMCKVARSQGLTVSRFPCFGACAVWKQTGKAGHIATVYNVSPTNRIELFNSGYNYDKMFYTNTIAPEGYLSGYIFQGYILPPPVNDVCYYSMYNKNQEKMQVKFIQSALKTLGYYAGQIDGDYGLQTMSAVCGYQLQNNLAIDGVFGVQCQKSLFGTIIP